MPDFVMPPLHEQEMFIIAPEPEIITFSNEDIITTSTKFPDVEI